MTAQITLQLDLTTDTTGNAEQVARMIGVSAWRISGDYLIIEDPLLDYRVTNNETYSHKTDRIPNGAVVILVQNELEHHIEQEIQSKNLNAPRITPEHIDSKIKAVEYILPRDVCKRDNGVEVFDAPPSLQTLTFCIITLENGFTVTGESACASPENFDADIGKEIAYDNAREKIWVLEGYLLKQHLYNYSIVPTESNIKAELQVNCDNGSEPKPELPKLSNNDSVKSPESTGVNQSCSGSGVDSHAYQFNTKRENAFLVAQLLNSNKISPAVRQKAEAKMLLLLDELI